MLPAGLVMVVAFLGELRRRSNEFHLEPAIVFQIQIDAPMGQPVGAFYCSACFLKPL